MDIPFWVEHISHSSYIEHLQLDNLKGRDLFVYNEVMNGLALRFTAEENDLYGWDNSKADLNKLHFVLTSDRYEVNQIKYDFPWENFKPHFIPVPGQPLIPIPWEGNLNLLADLLKNLKQHGAITLAPKVHVQAQKHFLWKGKKINTESLANAFKPNSLESNEKTMKIIRLITK